jgi:hypothetical protein
MRSLMLCLVCTFLLVACDATTDASDSLSKAPDAPALATAGNIVDPNTLIPAPPPGAVCRADGTGVICHTSLSVTPVNEPSWTLPCGTVFVTGTDDRRGIRWYNSDNKLVERFVSEDVEETLSLSSAGSGPTATATVHYNWRDVYAVPGDLSTARTEAHGVGLTIQAPGFGVIAHIAGLDPREGDHRGIFNDVGGPAVDAELCAALTR